MNNNNTNSLDLNNLVALDENRVKEIFDHTYQNKFIKVLLKDRDFFSDVFDIIVLQYFDDFQRLLIDVIIKFYNKNSEIPDYDDLKTQIRTTERNELRKDQFIGLIDRINNEVVVSSEKAIKDTALIFFKKRAVANALYKMANMWEKDDFEGMTQPLNEALKSGERKNSGLDYKNDIEKTLGEDIRKVVPIMKGINEEIGGGVSEGELIVAISPSGGGKSMFLVCCANESIMANKKVLYVSLELGEKYIMKRFHACFNKIHQKELNFFPDVIKEKSEEIFFNKSRQLKVKSFPTRKLTVVALKNYIESLERNEGFKPDILYLDYADIMNASSYDKEHRISLQILYQELRGLSSEIKMPIVTASQTNRSASKLERISVDNIAESYAKCAECDLVIGIGSGENGEKDEYGKPITLRQLNKATVGFLKSRLGRDSFYLDFILNTSTVQMELDKKDRVALLNNLAKNNLQNNSPKITDRDSKESINEILEKTLGNLG